MIMLIRLGFQAPRKEQNEPDAFPKLLGRLISFVIFCTARFPYLERETWCMVEPVMKLAPPPGPLAMTCITRLTSILLPFNAIAFKRLQFRNILIPKENCLPSYVD
jgi:hypothetical protein